MSEQPPPGLIPDMAGAGRALAQVPADEILGQAVYDRLRLTDPELVAEHQAAELAALRESEPEPSRRADRYADLVMAHRQTACRCSPPRVLPHDFECPALAWPS